jgi:hypothetical protein
MVSASRLEYWLGARAYTQRIEMSLTDTCGKPEDQNAA